MYKLEKWRIFEAQFQSLWVWSVSSAWSIYFETQLQLLVLHYSGKLPVHLDFPSMSKFQIWRRISRWTPKTRVLAVSACHSISKIIFNVQDFSIKNQPALLNSDFPAFCTYQSLYVYQEKMKNKSILPSRHNDEDRQKHWPGSQQAAKGLRHSAVDSGGFGWGWGWDRSDRRVLRWSSQFYSILISNI